MLKIKLLPTGKKHQRQYRVVVAHDKSKLTGKYIELLGTYNPLSDKDRFTINKDLYQSWLTKGAQPSTTIKSLVAKSK